MVVVVVVLVVLAHISDQTLQVIQAACVEIEGRMVPGEVVAVLVAVLVAVMVAALMLAIEIVTLMATIVVSLLLQYLIHQSRQPFALTGFLFLVLSFL